MTYINKNKLFLPHQKVLLAVSGGRDSVAMVLLFAESGLDFGIVHCNFQLRGEESEEDALFCKNLALQHKTPFYSTRFETKKEAKKAGVSTQMIARKLRYDYFEKIRIEGNYDYIATAHHLNDAIETVLLNLTKGTGIDGLKGILAKNNQIIRPLLFASRHEIDMYIKANKLIFREDSSNESIDYQRNKIRLEVIPLLKNINPNFENTFVDSLERLSDSAKIVKQETTSFFQNNEFQIEDLINSETPVLILFENLKKFHFNYKQCQLLAQSCNNNESKIFESSTHQIIKNRDNIVLKSLEINEQKFHEIEISSNDLNSNPMHFFDKDGQAIGEISLFKNNQMMFSKETNLEFFDADKIKFPLKIRVWQAGDTMIPIGMVGRKKISDILINLKASKIEKDKQLVMLDNEKIIWLINKRVCNQSKISDKTKQVLMVKMY